MTLKPATYTARLLFQVFVCLSFFMLGLAISHAADDAATGNTSAANCSYDSFKDALGARESGGDCSRSPGGSGTGYTCENGKGFAGKYQFGDEAWEETGYKDENGNWTGKDGITSLQKWKDNPRVQESAQNELIESEKDQARAKGLYKYIGTTTPNGTVITESGIIAGCHLIGCGGLNSCLSNNGKCTDGFSTSAFEYVQKFGNYDVGSGTDGQCKKYAATSDPRGATNGNPVCADKIYKGIDAQIQASLGRNNDFIKANVTPPPSLSQVANTPCMSKELQRVANRFAYAPSMYSSQGMSQFTSAAGPVSGLMQKMFKSSFDSITKSASLVPAMANFQSMASTALGSMLGSLGLGDAFSSEVCGLMVDMLVKYVQCAAPIQLPNLGNIFGSLNNLLPNNCAGNALKSTLYSAANMKSLQTYSQPISISNGRITAGSSDALDKAKGITP